MASQSVAQTSEENPNHEEEQQPRRGGLVTVPFILATEACDKFAGAGFHANMMSYLTLQLHMPLVEASNTLTNFGGTSHFTAVLGGLIADSFAGRFWTIAVGTSIYVLGMLCLTVTAAVPVFRPPECRSDEHTCVRASSWQVWVLYGCLLLSSIGSGGIRPCVMAFGADQFELHKMKQNWSFFNLYYFMMGIALLLALTVVVYIQDYVSWAWGLGIPTIAMGISLVIFVLGYPLYLKMKPGGSPVTRMAQVVVAAFRKRKEPMASDPSFLYQDAELDAHLSTTGRLLHTNQLRFLDRAAIVTENEVGTSAKPNLWKLSTVHRVEELKSLLRMLPIWFVGVMALMAISHNHSFVIMQARTMDRHLTPSFEIPPATMSIFTILTMLLSLAFYDRVLVPFARRITGHPSGITCLQRMGVGITIAIFATVTSALVEAKRKAAALDHGLLDKPRITVPLSVFWLVPQYAIHGMAEAFVIVGHLEFLYDQAPESMRSTALAMSSMAAAIGNYMGTLLVVLVRDFTRGRGEWLQDNINRGRLDCYYWLVCVLQLVQLLFFLVCASYYTPKPLEVAGHVGRSGANEEIELAGARVVEMEEEEEEKVLWKCSDEHNKV